MRYLILDSQINFYKEHGYIEFEDILSEEECEILKNEIGYILEKENITNLDPKEVYKRSRDLFRKSEKIKKFTLNRKFASIASSLSGIGKLRIAFDQTFFFMKKNIFEKNGPITNINSLQGIVNFMLLKLDDSEPKKIGIFPKKKCGCVFIKSKTLLDFDDLFSNEEFFLIAYGDLKTVFNPNHKDPNVNFLKQFGYSYGDTLKDATHPILC